MPNWTPKQKEAIDKEGTNILVSAGAGSGKTAVLSSRVIRKIKDGVNIDEILILTFTKAAAYEMMIRIRDNLTEESSNEDLDDITKANLVKQLDLIDKAYITTFDSFTSGVVKKYHDRLNISRNFTIVDENTIDLVRSRFLDHIFDKYYESDNLLFSKLISDYCLKSDKELKINILNINKALDLKYDKITYLNNYLNNHYNDNYYKTLIKEYEELLEDKISDVSLIFNTLKIEFDDNSYLSKLESILEPLFNSYKYDDIRENSNISLPKLPKNTEDTISDIKDKLSKKIKEIKEMTEYSKLELINDYKETYDYVNIIIKIILELDNKVNNYKISKNAFEFIDIEKLAIKLVKENSDIKEELRLSFKEIMVDEYQDTSDLQEELVSLISNNNNYMVGDIKQSIYRFRNANPNIFKDKYEKYQVNDGGIKIDLTKNFRSRDEVINDINLVFDSVMSIPFGGANYAKSHRLLFGLEDYLKKKKTNQEYSLSILNYNIDKKSKFKDNNEIEAFIIAKDIKDKVKNNYQIFDKDLKTLRNVKYSDFVILINKGASFTLYKKIFEYLNIPLTLERDVDISKEVEVSLIKNILIMIKSLKEDKIDDAFKYGYVSIARSYLFRLTDQEIYEIVNTNSYKDTIIYNKILKLVEEIDFIDLKSLILRIIEEFDFYEKMITVLDINLRITVLDKIVNLADCLTILDYDYLVFASYLEDILNDKDKKINVEIAVSDPNSVRLMTIHKSKGLEYPICYYAGLKNQFNFRSLNANLLYDNKYGIVTSNYNNGYHNVFVKELLRSNFIKEEISERIRLFYVALTRAREKMIIVTSLLEDSNLEEPTDKDKAKYKSFLDIMNSVKNKLKKYIKDVDLDEIKLTKDYLGNSEVKQMEEVIRDKLDVSQLSFEEEILEESHFSKTVNKLVTKEEKENMMFGTKIHELFELVDFKNLELDKLNLDDLEKKYITNFLNQPLLKNISSANILKEYEFYYNKDNQDRHGIIDLMLEYSNHIDIIDYKLKHIDDSAYIEQLNGYRDYIKDKYQKEVNIYLYSIIDNKINKLE